MGRIIEDATLYWNRTIARPRPKDFVRQMHHLTVRSITRRAKYLVFELQAHPEQSLAGTQSKGAHSSTPAFAAQTTPVRQNASGATLFLLIHLKMSGKLNVVDRTAPVEKHDRVVFDLDNGLQLRFNDVRKFGRMWLVIDPAEVTGQHGPEPLDKSFTLQQFRELIAGRAGAIKPLLLNQYFLSGVGNIYADEALWYAKIHPQRKADSLSKTEVAALYRSLRRVLLAAIDAQGTDAGDGVIEGDYRPRVYGRENQPCYRCHRPIQRTVVGQRGTHFCPNCQPKKRGLP